MGNCQFVEIKEDHLPEVTEIYNYYVMNTTATFHTEPLTMDEMRDLVFYNQPQYKTFIILQGREIKGYVSLKQYSKREAYDKTAEIAIYLVPGISGQGLGVEALLYIEDFAHKNSIHVLLALITGGNESSIRLFTRQGYEKCAHYREIGCKFGRLLDVVGYQKIILN